MAIEIYSGQTLASSIRRVLSASVTDRLSGESTFGFSVITPRSQQFAPGMTAKFNGQCYNIVRVERGISDGFPISMVACEHISYKLNDETYNLVTFVFEGTPTAGLTQLLEGTPFSVGIVEPTAAVAVAFTEGTLNRRNAVMRFIDACGGEIEYDGYNINIRTHRGSVARKALMDGENVTDVSVVLDSREEVSAYEISLFKMAELSAGDEVNITFSPLGINVDTRIVGITYNPFNRYTVQVEVGDYVPNLLASTSTQLDKIKQEFRAADGQMSSRIENDEGEISLLTQSVNGISTRISTAEGNISELSQTVDGFNTRITNAEGSVSSLSQTVGGFDTRITDAENNVSELTQTVNGFDTRITNTEGSVSAVEQRVTSITTRVSTAETNISSVTQTADKISWLVKSGTSSSNFTLTDRALSLTAANIDLSGYVTISNLSTSGRTTVNGSNITTGTIDASKVTVTNLDASKITTGQLSATRIDVSTISIAQLKIGSKVAIDSQSSTIYIGGDSSNNAFTNVYIKASQTINITAWASIYDGLTIDISNKTIRPNKDNYYSLGTSSYSFSQLYVQDATIGNTTYNLRITNRQIYPSTNTTSYPWYLGKSGNAFMYCYVSNLYANNLAQLGNITSAKVGFFGTTPVSRKSVSDSATVATLITALKGYGLIA